MIDRNSGAVCPKWDDLGHNYLLGGRFMWRAWHRLQPWKKYRECLACRHRDYR